MRRAVRSALLLWFALYVLGALLALSGPSNLATVAGIPVFVTAPLVALAAALTPRVPIRLVGLPLLVVAWGTLGAMPLPLWTSRAQALVGAIAIAALIPVALAARHLGPWEARPAFDLRRTVAAALGVGFGAPVVLLAYLWSSVACTLHRYTDGFAVLDLGGIHLTERTYVRGGTTVHLVGMMHIGEQRAYDDLYDGFGALPDAVVLAEGVSDDHERLPDALGYGRAAARLDLVQQPPIEREGLEVRNADIDISELSPEVRRFIEAALGVWSADDPGRAYLELVRSVDGDRSEDTARLLWDELIEGRNQRVLREIRRAAGEYRHVIVPWGAIHMPGIAATLQDEGWAPVDEIRRRVIGHNVVLAVLR